MAAIAPDDLLAEPPGAVLGGPGAVLELPDAVLGAPDELLDAMAVPPSRPEPPAALPCGHPGTSSLIARHAIAAEPGSCKEARDFVSATLSQWGMAELGCDAIVVISELVTNALRHTSTPRAAGRVIEVILSGGPRQLLCAVTDWCERPPVLRQPDYVSETGRGLHVVASLSDAWGWLPLAERGKAVWAALGLPVLNDRPSMASCEDDNS